MDFVSSHRTEGNVSSVFMFSSVGIEKEWETKVLSASLVLNTCRLQLSQLVLSCRLNHFRIPIPIMRRTGGRKT